MIALLDSLTVQWGRCGGENCKVRNCKRCARYRAWCQNNKSVTR